MRRILPVIVLFFAASGFANGQQAPSKDAAAAAVPAQKVVPGMEESLNGSQYINKTAKFSLVLPAEWIINKEVRHSPSTLAWLSTPDKQSWVGVTREQGTGIAENAKEVFEASIRKNLTNYEKLSESSVVIDGKPAFLLTFRAAVPGHPNLHVSYLAAVIPSGSTTSTVMAWCAELRFQEMRPTFEKILTSYRGAGQPISAASASQP
jgi:hypothetical protein